MPFIASNGLTETGTGKTIAVGGMPGGMNVHYHDVGEGEPVLFLHSYGPGTTAWITFHKTVGGLSQHFRCILMDLPNFSKTGPIVYRDGVHAVPDRHDRAGVVPIGGRVHLGMDPGSHANHDRIERSSDRAASSASRALYQSRASISSARAAEPKTADGTVSAVVEARP